MQLEPNKLKYIINHLVGPSVQEFLKDLVRNAEWFVVSFNESLNKITRASEMDHWVEN